MAANETVVRFFPRMPIFTFVLAPSWRDRLRTAVERSGRKHSAIARDAGISAETLSRVLTGRHANPAFETVVRVARAVHENVGWLLNEHGFGLSSPERAQLQKSVRLLDDLLLPPSRAGGHEPNAVLAHTADIPHVYVVAGARLAYQASGDSMLGVGIADRDLVYVRPTCNLREAIRRIVVCRWAGATYLKVLDVRAGRVRLLSRNDRYASIDVTAEELEVIGIVVGRSGSL